MTIQTNNYLDPIVQHEQLFIHESKLHSKKKTSQPKLIHGALMMESGLGSYTVVAMDVRRESIAVLYKVGVRKDKGKVEIRERST